MKENAAELKLVLNEILEIMEANAIESKLQHALTLINKIESEHRLSDILSDEWHGLTNISNALSNLKNQANFLEDTLFPEKVIFNPLNFKNKITKSFE